MEEKIRALERVVKRNKQELIETRQRNERLKVEIEETNKLIKLLEKETRSIALSYCIFSEDFV
jgi:hypothetical protein